MIKLRTETPSYRSDVSSTSDDMMTSTSHYLSLTLAQPQPHIDSRITSTLHYISLAFAQFAQSISISHNLDFTWPSWLCQRRVEKSLEQERRVEELRCEKSWEDVRRCEKVWEMPRERCAKIEKLREEELPPEKWLMWLQMSGPKLQSPNNHNLATTTPIGETDSTFLYRNMSSDLCGLCL